jgi:hypothetical protein
MRIAQRRTSKSIISSRFILTLLYSIISHEVVQQILLLLRDLVFVVVDRTLERVLTVRVLVVITGFRLLSIIFFFFQKITILVRRSRSSWSREHERRRKQKVDGFSTSLHRGVRQACTCKYPQETGSRPDPIFAECDMGF